MSKHICRSKGRGGKYKAFCGISLDVNGEWASGSPFDCDDKISERDIRAATCEQCVVEFIECAKSEARRKLQFPPDYVKKIDEARDVLLRIVTDSEQFEEFAEAVKAGANQEADERLDFSGYMEMEYNPNEKAQ